MTAGSILRAMLLSFANPMVVGLVVANVMQERNVVTEAGAYVAVLIVLLFQIHLLTQQLIIVLLTLLPCTVVFITLEKTQKTSCHAALRAEEALRTTNLLSGVVRSKQPFHVKVF